MTERQRIFARIIAADPEENITKAALSAGCTPKSAHVVGFRWLKLDKVQDEIARIRSQKVIKLDISAEKVLRELARLAFLDPRKLFAEDGSLKPINELDDDTAAAIAGVEYEKLFEHFGKGQAKHVGTTTKVKLINKTAALEMLGKYLKLFQEQNQTIINVNILSQTIQERRQAIYGNGSTPGN